MNLPEHPFSRDVRDLLDTLDARIEGLTKQEAEARLEQWGPNTLPKQKKQHPVMRFLSHFHNVLIYVLIAAGVVTALLGHWIDTWIILAVVIINALIGFIQEGKAEQALKAVEGMLSHHARVLRDGDVRQIEASRLVPGDIVTLAAGDKVPADLRVIEARDLQVNEASLTGESEPVFKQEQANDPSAGLGDRSSMAFSGTLVTSGSAKALVVATGAGTELGKINAMLSGVESMTTPLLRQVASFGTKLTLVILALGAVTLAAGYFAAGMDVIDLFMAVVGIAVASIPEGLPAIMTITLAIGVQRMAGRHAIIRKLPGVETLGSVTVICSDKTGTLTRSEMTVTEIITRSGSWEVSGSGYAPEGSFTPAPDDKVLKQLLTASVLCNDARLRDTSDGWIVEGNPTEGALLAAAAKADIWMHDLHKKHPREGELPFSSSYKFMATAHAGGTSFPLDTPKKLRLIKGAPEVILSRCSKEIDSSGSVQPVDSSFWEEQASLLAQRGHRVLAVAQGEGDGDITPESAGEDLVLLGITGIIDPPRDEAIRAVKECKEAGIRVKMITGDHALTATFIAAQLGIGDGERVIDGIELDGISDEDLVTIADEVDVFARVSPEHKLRLVTALQQSGHITAMTGDGVNDAPALKKADIGIAMGIKGTEAAKEASDMVLADDNFASIAHAVEEGRTVYDNLKKSLLFILPTNGGEALIIIASIVFGFMLPITPAQILWVNMVTAVTLALALAFEPMEHDVMQRPPRSSRESLVPGTLLVRILVVSLLLMAASLGLFALLRSQGAEISLARTMAVNTLVVGEIVYLFNSRLMGASSLSVRGFRATKYVWLAVAAVAILQLLYTYLPLFHTLFDSSPLTLAHWGLILLAGAGVFLAVETEKLINRKLQKEKL